MILLEATSPVALGDRLFEALALLVIALVVAVTNRITNRPLKKKLDHAETKLENTTSTVDEVKSTLTENNGGSTVKDSLDKILANQVRHDLQFKFLETQQNNIQAKQDRMDEKQDRLDAKTDAIDKKVNDHIHGGLGRRKLGKKK